MMTTEEFNDWKWEQERLAGSYRAQTEAFMPSQSTNKKQSASSMRDEDFPEDYFGCGDDR
jgi:hypothetical protein